MEKVSIAFTVSSTNYEVPLGFSVLYNNRTVIDIDYINKQKTVAFDLEIEDGAQQLNFVMKNKTVDHTVIDESNNIISDACLTINDVTIENVDLGYNFIKHSTYTHNFNGTQDSIKDSFHGTMGCNGTVTFEFSSPFYIWLLENF